MARRRRQGTAEDIMDAVSRLPWWMGLGLALASYLLLHWWAERPMPPVDPRRVADSFLPMWTRGIAMGLQYVVPIMCGVAALISFLRRRQREGLAEAVAGSAGADALNGMSWREFEMLVGEAFRRRGYAVEETGGGGADGGVDLVLRKDGKTFLVQCKQWKVYSVPVQTVRELYGVMVHHKAAGAFVVTSGRFSEDAAAFARGKGIQLVDGVKLVADVKASAVRSASSRDLATPPRHPNAGGSPEIAAAPACPACGSGMVRRTAKKGVNAGNQFWGCSRYPTCRGVR